MEGVIIMKSTVIGVFIGLFLMLATSVKANELVEPNLDTFIRMGVNHSHGNDELIMVKRENGGSGSNNFKGILQFDYIPSNRTGDVTLYLDLVMFDRQSSGAPTSATFYVWGLKDSYPQNFYEGMTALGAFDSSGDGVHNGHSSLYDGNPSQSGGQAIGTFTVTSSDLHSTISFSNAGLTDFLATDTDGVVTLLLTRATDSSHLMTAFASKEHHLNSPPRLHMELEDEIITASDDTYGRLGSKNSGVWKPEQYSCENGQ